jgi:ABC-2 type transport system permease protein
MLRTLGNIFWLGTKELRSLQRDVVLVVFVVYSFSLAIYMQARGTSTEVHNASIGLVDEDQSALSGRIANAFFAPNFQKPVLINAAEIDQAMDDSRFMFVLVFPPGFEQKIIEGDPTEIQLNIDATAMGQGGIGATYIQNIVQSEVNRFVRQKNPQAAIPVELVTRRAFNSNGNPVWFASLMALVNQVTMLTIILTGAALIREREHGTIEHLLVMPLNSFEIALAKVWANGLVILVAVMFSLHFVIRGALEVPIEGSPLLFIVGTAVYLFSVTAIGIFLGTVTRTMAQFAMLVILLILALQLLSGGTTPVESQPEWLQSLTFFLPSRHYVEFSQAIIYRGAGFDIVWHSFVTVAIMGLFFFGISLVMFRRSIAASR